MRSNNLTHAWCHAGGHCECTTIFAYQEAHESKGSTPRRKQLKVLFANQLKIAHVTHLWPRARARIGAFFTHRWDFGTLFGHDDITMAACGDSIVTINLVSRLEMSLDSQKYMLKPSYPNFLDVMSGLCCRGTTFSPSGGRACPELLVAPCRVSR
jgi:hypothetical protein